MQTEFQIAIMTAGPRPGRRTVCPTDTPCISVPLGGAFPRWAEYMRAPNGDYYFACVTNTPRGWDADGR